MMADEMAVQAAIAAASASGGTDDCARVPTGQIATGSLAAMTLGELAETCRTAARLLTVAESHVNWLRGDIAIEVETRHGAELAEFARAAGVSLASLESYRTTASAWPPESRRLDIAWSVHQALNAQGDRAELLHGRDTWTLAQARGLVRGRLNLPHSRGWQVEAWDASAGAAEMDPCGGGPLADDALADDALDVHTAPSGDGDNPATVIGRVLFAPGTWTTERAGRLAGALSGYLGLDDMRMIMDAIRTLLETAA